MKDSSLSELRAEVNACLKETAMKLKCGDPEVMVAPSVPSPPIELQGSGDGNEVEEIAGDDDSEVQDSGDSNENDDGGLNCGSLEDTSLPFVVQLRNLNEVFCKTTVSHARGDSGIKLIDKLCGMLRGVIQRASDDDIAAAAVSPETSSTCEYLLMVLSSPGQLSLTSVAQLLHSLCQLIGVITGSNTWLAEGCLKKEKKRKKKRKGCLKHIDQDMDCRTKFTGSQFGSMCSELLKYLTDLVPDLVVEDDYDLCRVFQEAFSDAVDDLHKFACWGLSYYGSCPVLADVRDSLCKLQENVWEQALDTGFGELACKRIGAAINAQSANSGTETWFSLQWLEEKKIVGEILCHVYLMEDVPEVTQFLTILGKHEVVVKERCILKGFKMIYREYLDEEEINAAHEICAHMLEVLDISTYSDKFLESVLGWLETRQANSVIGGLRRFSILKKLHKIDKQRRWEERVCTLFRKCATSVSSCDLVECLKEVADHYNTKPYHVGGSSKDSFLHKDEELQAKLLQDCSSADVVTCISDMANGALNHSKLYIQKAETWKAKEVDLDDHMNSSSKLTEALSTAFPNFRRETAKRCLDRMVLAQHLSVGLNPNKSNTFTSEIATAMSPELQALEALKNESLLHCKVVQRVDELSEKHVRDYDALREKQYEELVKFAEACRKEKDDVVWDALYEKVKALAVVERTGVGEDKDMSSEDILKRLFLNTVGACKQIEAKLSQVEKEHRGSLDRLPNVECAVCCSEFSAKRKRACLDPCGHASACVDCATQVWKRTKKCFVCNTSIGQPVGVPSKLFF